MDDRVVVVPKAGADLYLSELEMSGTAPCETPESFPASPADGRTRIGIKVQDGCDNACTYCIVHVARGLSLIHISMKSGSNPDEVFYRWLVETLKR